MQLGQHRPLSLQQLRLCLLLLPLLLLLWLWLRLLFSLWLIPLCLLPRPLQLGVPMEGRVLLVQLLLQVPWLLGWMLMQLLLLLL
jgi:hypothetical protein